MHLGFFFFKKVLLGGPHTDIFFVTPVIQEHLTRTFPGVITGFTVYLHLQTFTDLCFIHEDFNQFM